MPAIVLQGFKGEMPRVIPRMLDGNAAQVAVNARLDDGALTPINRSSRVGEAGGDDHQTIYRFGDTWLSWAGVVHAVPGPVATDRLYYTGDGVPKMRVGSDIYDLALPIPAAPSVALGGVGSGDVETRVYVWTWVTDFGEESEPSPASPPIDWQPGNTVTVSGFTAAPAGRAITKQRIYRSQTGKSGTYLYFIAERAASNTNFVDNLDPDDFAEPLPSADWNAPPAGLKGLVAMPNGMMAGFDGKRLYLAEPWHMHAWPEKYVLTTDSNIVGLSVAGTSLFVLTEGFPYVAQGTHPSSMQMIKAELPLPCTNARGIVDLGASVCFPSNEGLALLAADGSALNATEALFDRQKWEAFKPSTMIGAQSGGRYVAFYDTDSETIGAGSLVITVEGGAHLRRGSAAASAVWFDIKGSALYFLRKGTNDIWRYDDPAAVRHDLYWKSKPFVLPAGENYGAIQIDADTALSGDEADALAAEQAVIIAANEALLAAGSIGDEVGESLVGELPVAGDILQPMPDAGARCVVSVHADGVLKKQISTTNKAVRLPSGFTARTWEIEVAGNLSISRIVMAKTMEEIEDIV